MFTHNTKAEQFPTYKYPELDTHQNWAKVYPQELFDFIDECAKEAEKEEKKEAKRKKKK